MYRAGLVIDLASVVSGYFDEDLKKGILVAAVFPLLLLAGIVTCRMEKK